MSRKAGEGINQGDCGYCLPEALPREVQRCIDESGGIGALVERSSLPDDFPDLLRILKALSDDLRWQILALLTQCPMCACVLKSVTGMSDSRLSYHLNILKKAQLVDVRKSGSFIIYTLSDRGRSWIETFLVNGELSSLADE